MRPVAFALSLLVLGSFAAAAQEARPMPMAGLSDRAQDAAAIGVGAVLGLFLAEPLGVTELVGTLAGITIGTWWYAAHQEDARRPAIRQMAAAREAIAGRGDTPPLALRPISRNF